MAALLSRMRQNAPSAVFEAVPGLVKVHLSERESANLGAAIGPMPLPGDESMAQRPANELAAA